MKLTKLLLWVFTILIVPTWIMLMFALNGYLGISTRWWIFCLAFVLATIVLLSILMSWAEASLPLKALVFKGKDGETIPYRLLKPVNYDPTKSYPLVLFLHGAGERGADNKRQMIHGVPQFASKENRETYPCFLIAPQCPANSKWVDVDWAADAHSLPQAMSEPARLAVELIESIANEFTIDKTRVYITGISMGGYGTWDLIARFPDLFAAAVPICGGADEATAEKIKHIPVWVVHGAKDVSVKPERSRNIVAALEKVGGNVKYTEYADVGHDSWKPAYDDPELFKWLFAQRR